MTDIGKAAKPSLLAAPGNGLVDGPLGPLTVYLHALEARVAALEAQLSASALMTPAHAAHRVPDPGAAKPKSPAAGLTLPQAVLLFQPIFKCWTGRCSTCRQPIDLAHLPLHPPPKRE